MSNNLTQLSGQLSNLGSSLSGMAPGSLSPSLGNSLTNTLTSLSGVLGGMKSGQQQTPAQQQPVYTQPTQNPYIAPDIQSSYSVYDSLMNFLLKPEEQQEVRDKFTGLGQPLIDNIQTQTSLMLADSKRAANELLARNRALMSRSGLSGSQFDTRSIADAEKYNLQQEQRIRAEQDKKVLDVTKELTSMAENVIAKNKEFAMQAANLKTDAKMTEAMKGLETEYTTTFINKMKQEMANSMESLRLENAEKSLSMAAYLAKSGVSFDDLPFSTSSAIKAATGLDDSALKLYFNYNKEVGQQIDYKVEKIDNTLMFYGVDPKTGKLETIKYTLPSSGTTTKNTVKVTPVTIKDPTVNDKETTMFLVQTDPTKPPIPMPPSDYFNWHTRNEAIEEAKKKGYTFMDFITDDKQK